MHCKISLLAPNVAVDIVDELHKVFFRKVLNIDSIPTGSLLTLNRVIVKITIHHSAFICNEEETEVLRLCFAEVFNLRVSEELNAIFILQNFENLLFCHIQ
jgi:hypothetical protein